MREGKEVGNPHGLKARVFGGDADGTGCLGGGESPEEDRRGWLHRRRAGHGDTEEAAVTLRGRNFGIRKRALMAVVLGVLVVIGRPGRCMGRSRRRRTRLRHGCIVLVGGRVVLPMMGARPESRSVRRCGEDEEKGSEKGHQRVAESSHSGLAGRGPPGGIRRVCS